MDSNSRSPDSGDTPQRPLIASPGIIFREISACASHQRLRPPRGNPPSFPGKSPVPRKGPRSTPPGPCACISENVRASKRQLVPPRSSVGFRGAKGKPGPRKVTGSSQRSPLHAAGTRCLHFGKCACKQATTRFPPTKERAARPNGAARIRGRHLATGWHCRRRSPQRDRTWRRAGEH